MGEGGEMLDTIEFEPGTLIRVDGIPFTLSAAAQVLGRAANLALVSQPARVVADEEGGGKDGIRID